MEALARKVAGGSRARLVNAEYDDLRQEGLIDVWQSLGRGVTPSADMIENRMRDWVRFLGRQLGHGAKPCQQDPADCPQHVPYDALLPLDDFRVVTEV